MKNNNTLRVGDEIYTFRESEMWVACWRRFDVVAQGKDENAAVANLIKTIGQLAIGDGMDGKLPSFGSCDPVGSKLLARWQRLHTEWHD